MVTRVHFAEEVKKKAAGMQHWINHPKSLTLCVFWP
jgi:hypothetical protein